MVLHVSFSPASSTSFNPTTLYITHLKVAVRVVASEMRALVASADRARREAEEAAEAAEEAARREAEAAAADATSEREAAAEAATSLAHAQRQAADAEVSVRKTSFVCCTKRWFKGRIVMGSYTPRSYTPDLSSLRIGRRC